LFRLLTPALSPVEAEREQRSRGSCGSRLKKAASVSEGRSLQTATEVFFILILQMVMEVLADGRQIYFHLQPEREQRSGCFIFLSK
jgi:hypothetical protein